ncbi:hypothetical protein [Humisphaera borealis]|uniref:TolC family protein n=1 Tax=Humisphaera borealis TaxID=2807512 RepID=A0A7M2X2B1_9BACT|nr:hypothetical protein [Humisphaera borealis]QOV91835.1 hypothetical protein IPV69_10970 [Humisphaera borealis]
MVLLHRRHGGVARRLGSAAVVALTAITLTSGRASAQVAPQVVSTPGGTEWYRQAPAQPVPAAPQQVIPQAQVQPAQMQPAPFQPAPVQPAQPVMPAAQPAPQPNVPPANAVQPNGFPGGVFAQPAMNPALRPYQMPGVYSPYGGGGSVSGIYPSAEMNSYVNATARAATARALFRQAESELNQAYRAAQRFFDNAPQYKQSIKEEQDAFAALSNARTKALSSLESDQKYQRLLALREDLGEKLLDGRIHRSLSHEEVVAMASLKMSYATEMRAIEATALANEPSVKEAQDRLVQAGARVSEMRQGFEESLRINPDILLARRNLDDARIARLTSEAYLRATMVNGSYALDYAYYLYRTPTQYDRNGGFGYGY